VHHANKGDVRDILTFETVFANRFICLAKPV
jgi:hypothetical protein